MNTIKKYLLVVILLTGGMVKMMATEGMWVPFLISQLQESEMREMGMKMSADDIYSVNHGSLKDAIVHFGGFCTGEVISKHGLILTNHHCGYGQIQAHSTVEDNLLENGFWAENYAAEKPNPGLFVTFIQSIEDVTDQILLGVKDKMKETKRQSIVDKNIDALKKTIQLKEFEDVLVRPFFKGNQYFLFRTVSYHDIRLVGTPPESIGKFGHDTDNWVWPRHTGDFSLFRIYAGPNNEPAAYSENNKPYDPKYYLKVSRSGVEEGDFTLVYGFPGRTNEYLPAIALKQIVEEQNPPKIALREAALKVMNKYMRQDEKVKIQYSSKAARISNYWKKWMGESLGIEKTNGIAKKEKVEEKFNIRLNRDKKKNRKYGKILPKLNELYADRSPYAIADAYYWEVMATNNEALKNAFYLNRLLDKSPDAYSDYAQRLKNYLGGKLKDFYKPLDAEIFTGLISYFKDNSPRPTGLEGFEGDLDKIYDKSILTDPKAVLNLFDLNVEDLKAKLKADELFGLASKIMNTHKSENEPEFQKLTNEINLWQRRYMKALMDVIPEKTYYPDANSTLRISYGQVEGYEPRDGVYHQHQTYLDGVIEKYKPNDYEFDVPQKLIDLYEKKDYGKWGYRGKMPLCFLGSNHTTGGNSGSPVLEEHGYLVGLNFDRVWEGTMSDYNYDKSICRNIMVDIRYIMFIIDKFAGATHITDEITFMSAGKMKMAPQIKLKN